MFDISKRLSINGQYNCLVLCLSNDTNSVENLIFLFFTEKPVVFISQAKGTYGKRLLQILGNGSTMTETDH